MEWSESLVEWWPKEVVEWSESLVEWWPKEVVEYYLKSLLEWWPRAPSAMEGGGVVV